MMPAEAEGAPLSSERAEPVMRLDALPLDFVLFIPLWRCALTRVILEYLRGIPEKDKGILPKCLLYMHLPFEFFKSPLQGHFTH